MKKEKVDKEEIEQKEDLKLKDLERKAEIKRKQDERNLFLKNHNNTMKAFVNGVDIDLGPILVNGRMLKFSWKFVFKLKAEFRRIPVTGSIKVEVPNKNLNTGSGFYMIDTMVLCSKEV